MVKRVPKCKVCKKEFKPFQSTQQVCGWECAQKFAEQKRLKKERKEYLEGKEKQKSRSDWLADVQTVFNKYIRLRDTTLPCISCGREHKGQYHAGHYRTVGANPELRFCELNVHKQCAPCNDHLHGNIVNYRIGLVARIGIHPVEWLEGKHEPKHYTIEELKALKKLYQDKIKSLA